MESPDVGARSDILAAIFPVEHRAARDHDRGYIAAGRSHNQRWRGLVAAAHQNHSIDRVAADAFLDIHADQVAEQHRGGAKIGFASGHHREFERKTARLPHSTLHLLRESAEMGIAWGQFRPCVADAYHGASVEDMTRKSLIAHPAPVNESVFVILAEPGCGPKLPIL